LAYLGNVVEVWEKFDQENLKIDIGSDQTSLHNPWAGGYYPVGISFEDSNKMMAENPELFKEKVQESLRRHAAAINKHTEKGTYFFDYGNAFLLNVPELEPMFWQKIQLWEENLNIQVMFKILWDRCVLIMVSDRFVGFVLQENLKIYKKPMNWLAKF
jgi:hypothetical protein